MTEHVYTHEEVCRLLVEMRDMARAAPQRVIIPVQLADKIVGHLYEDDDVAAERWAVWLKENNL